MEDGGRVRDVKAVRGRGGAPRGAGIGGGGGAIAGRGWEAGAGLEGATRLEGRGEARAPKRRVRWRGGASSRVAGRSGARAHLVRRASERAWRGVPSAEAHDAAGQAAPDVPQSPLPALLRPPRRRPCSAERAHSCTQRVSARRLAILGVCVVPARVVPG